MSYKQLFRSTRDRKIAGVAGGIAEYFNIDPTLVRLLWVVAVISGGVGVLAYIIAWLVIPETPFSENIASQPAEAGSVAAEASGYPQSNHGSQKGLAFVGVFLILLGGVFLLRQLVPWFGRFSWPLFLVVLGIAIIFLPFRGSKQ